MIYTLLLSIVLAMQQIQLVDILFQPFIDTVLFQILS